jgi:hypothetical protein
VILLKIFFVLSQNLAGMTLATAILDD